MPLAIKFADLAAEQGYPQAAALSSELKKMSLRPCDCCGEKERTYREWKQCARYKCVIYCSVACQREAWKTHKQACAGKAAAGP